MINQIAIQQASHVVAWVRLLKIERQGLSILLNPKENALDNGQPVGIGFEN